jgi:hypothetical protein
MNGPEFDGYLSSIVRSTFAAPIKWLSNTVHIVLALLVLVGVWLAYKGISRVPEHYKAIGRLECQQATNGTAAKGLVQQAASVASAANAEITRATNTGHAFESSRSRITSHYQRLDQEARHAPTDPVDSCVLPPDRLRIWTDANDGGSAAAAADQGAAASQPHDSASAATPASVWPHARPGTEPQGRGQGLPPAGQPALQPTRVPGDRT